MKPKYLVTGGAGFIGSNIVAALISFGHTVRVLDNFSTGNRENIASMSQHIELIEGDICDRELVRRSLKGISYVLHQAALPSVPRSMKDPVATHHINTTGTLTLLQESVRAKIKSFVYASSSSVYGDQPVLPKRESQTPHPQSPYALSKYICEQYAQLFNSLYGLPCVGLRYFNVFGPRQDPASDYAAVIPAFITAFQRGEAPRINGDGLQTRDFTYVDNVVQANLKAAQATGSSVVLNIGSGRRCSVKELCHLIKEKMHSSIQPVHGPPRAGDVKDSLADISRASDILGYTPSVSFEAGLDKTIAWFTHQRIA